jgi:hypothetical protein
MSETIYVPRAFGGVLIIQYTPFVYTTPLVLSVSFASPKAHINPIFSEVAMTTPNTTIDSSATVKDQYGNLISSLSTYTLLVVYPDFTTANPSVTNAGSGVYTATYATKGPGIVTELWSFVDASGAVAQDSRALTIAY